MKAIIPLSYALTRDGQLPVLSENVLWRAVELYWDNCHNTKVVITADSHNSALELRLKCNFLEPHIPRRDLLVASGTIFNTVQEARAVAKAMDQVDCRFEEIILLVHPYHARRALLVYQQLLPSAVKISVEGVEGEMNNHPQLLWRHPWLQWLAGWVTFGLLKVFGADSWLAKLQQPRG